MNNLLQLILVLQTTIENFYPYLIKLSIILWMILLLNEWSSYRLSILGIYPRKFWSLLGIICSPFLHASFSHLFYNLIPLLALSLLLLAFGPEFYWNITWILILSSGGLTWLFARPGIHIGASGLITAYWGFLVTQAIMGTFQLYHFMIGFICIYYFFGIFFGIFPRNAQVSWEGHLFGLIAGILTYLIGYQFSYFSHFILSPPYLFNCPLHLLT
jgi:membrane associated rhomboid family serine protease